MTEVYDSSETPFGNYVNRRALVEAEIVEDDAVARKVALKEEEKQAKKAGRVVGSRVNSIRRGSRFNVANNEIYKIKKEA